MNQAVLFKKIALSTLLISAVATPTYFASAANGPMVKQYVSSMGEIAKHVTADAKFETLTNSTFAVSSVGMSDPLELAERYAPTTVEDWKQTLAQYDKLMGDNIKFTVTSVDSAVPSKVSIGSAVALESISMKIGDAKLQQSVPAQFVKLEKAEKLEKSTVSIKALPAQTIAIDSKDFDVAGKVTAANDAGTAIAFPTINGQTNEFFKANIALDKAVESDDAATIKSALAKLLEVYKDQISELQSQH